MVVLLIFSGTDDQEVTMSYASVRYIVDDVDDAVAFYGDRLGFDVASRPGPGFAILRHGALRLLLSEPRGPGGTARATDGQRPEPGGWNRLQLEVEDLEARVAQLRDHGVRFRGRPVHGRGGDQVLVEDPSGNPVELFQPAR
jgi:catechol 2,3-dioxygenase-like lactoylglutathione lyase family enzyme